MFQIHSENFTVAFFSVGLAWLSLYLSKFSHVLELQTLEEKCLLSFLSLNPPPVIFTPLTSELWRSDMKLVACDVKTIFCFREV